MLHIRIPTRAIGNKVANKVAKMWVFFQQQSAVQRLIYIIQLNKIRIANTEAKTLPALSMRLFLAVA